MSGFAGSRTYAAADVAGKIAEETTMPSPKLVIFGGSGFVGSAVCQHAVASGIPTLSVNRSGRPSTETGAWADEVEWLRGDALRPETYQGALSGCIGVVSCIGLLATSYDSMRRINGDANVAVIAAAASARAPRFAYISAHDFQFPGDLGVLRGYFEGKRQAEAALREHFPATGVALRPSFIYGTRRWGSVQIPLGAVGAPLEALVGALPEATSKSVASIPILGAAFLPPVPVTAVAKAAVAAATDPSVAPGVMDLWTIRTYR